MSTDIVWSNLEYFFSPNMSAQSILDQGETLALNIWASRTEALAPNAADIANLSSAILMIMVFSFSIGARFLSSYLDKKNGGK